LSLPKYFIHCQNICKYQDFHLAIPTQVSTSMPWMYQDQPIDSLPEGTVGFVYLITHLVTGRKYVGKKLAQFKKSRPPLKGRSNRRRSLVESDWRDYWGSNDVLLMHVQQQGQDQFTRQILYICRSRGVMAYLEALEQFERRVLESDEYYNGIINVRIGSSNLLREELKRLKAKP